MKKKTKKITKQDQEILETNKQKENAITRANMYSSPFAQAVYTTKQVYRNEEVDLSALAENIHQQQQSVRKGNSVVIEEMLLSQAQTLQALFYFAAKRVSHCDLVNKITIYGDLAIKTNNACRKTLLALDQIKNPTGTTFIKQQNNAVNQQINQDNVISSPTNSEISEKKPTNELLNQIEANYALLDKSRENKASTVDTSVAALEKINRSKN